MIFDAKPFEELTESDLNRIMQFRIPESKSIDYKWAMPNGTDHHKREFLADVSSFANSSGGYLLFGIKEEKGEPIEITGITVEDPDREILRLDDMIRSGIEPRIRNVQIRAIPLANRNYVIIIKIPASFLMPHMVTFRNHAKFYARHSAGKYQLDVTELRSSFVLSEQIQEKVNELRTQRIGKLISGDVWGTKTNCPRVVLHLIPFRSFDVTNPSIDLMSVIKKDWPLQPLVVEATNNRFTFEGLLRYSGVNSYVQLFHNGAIEVVSKHFFENELFYIDQLEQELLRALKKYMSLYQQLKLEPPYVIMLSLLHVRDYEIPTDERVPFETYPIDRDYLIVPGFFVDSTKVDVRMLVRHLFDPLWNACGYPKSPNFKKLLAVYGTDH